MADDLEKVKFEAELLEIFEKKRYILSKYTEEGFAIQGEGVAEIKVNTDEFLKMHKSGKSAEEIVEIIIGARRVVEEKPVVDNIYPLVKDKYYVSAYQNALKQAAEKAGMTWDNALLPMIFKNWPDKEIYMFCGATTEKGYRYITNKEFPAYGLDEKKFFRMIFDNLYGKLDGFVKDGLVKITKQEDGSFILNVQEDLAASFLIIAERYFDFIQRKIDNDQAEFFYAFTVSTEEVYLCDPKTSVETLKTVINKITERQKELTSLHHPLTIEPLLITRKGITFMKT
ncbi:MAG: hypothetical protein ABID61_03490 [Candidatus Micrarchaeota archaeon]